MHTNVSFSLAHSDISMPALLPSDKGITIRPNGDESTRIKTSRPIFNLCIFPRKWDSKSNCASFPWVCGCSFELRFVFFRCKSVAILIFPRGWMLSVRWIQNKKQRQPKTIVFLFPPKAFLTISMFSRRSALFTFYTFTHNDIQRPRSYVDKVRWGPKISKSNCASFLRRKLNMLQER